MKCWASRDRTNLKSTDLCGINITTPKYGLLYHFNVIQSRDLCTGHLAQTYGHLKDISFWKPSKGIGSIINMGILHPCHDIIRDLLNVARNFKCKKNIDYRLFLMYDVWFLDIWIWWYNISDIWLNNQEDVPWPPWVEYVTCLSHALTTFNSSVNFYIYIFKVSTFWWISIFYLPSEL